MRMRHATSGIRLCHSLERRDTLFIFTPDFSIGFYLFPRHTRLITFKDARGAERRHHWHSHGLWSRIANIRVSGLHSATPCTQNRQAALTNRDFPMPSHEQKKKPSHQAWRHFSKTQDTQ
ncbi:hypothetical protein Zmor_003416 [Zophobas morio]|uniref:Uncharacterized protein n=1 Tax=Zophobas morio TaxID=2755281 RepID=A0AA38M198_9CUCU|nr:hypothetical protein Zmor_003416 [Zophobas morio]